MRVKSGFTAEGRPFSKTDWKDSISEDFKLLDSFTEEEQRRVLSWIKENIAPAKKEFPRTSYGLKHFFQSAEGGFYMTNNQFKDAMNKAGYKPIDETELNWTYRITVKKEAMIR